LRIAGQDHAVVAPRDASSVIGRAGVAGIAVPFSFAEQNVAEELPKVRRAKLGVIGTDPLAARFPEGRDRAIVPVLVDALKSLVKARRTFRQAALQFALANQHLDCVIVEVATVEELDEVLDAPESEPLTIPDLERIFETYAHRYDDDPGVGCGGGR
jgi:aryl-alcohol dehydrogenase-like predicted oxidoreductase